MKRVLNLLRGRVTNGLARTGHHRFASSSPVEYSDGFIRGVLNDVKTIAVVGASDKWQRPSPS